jgi:hypothetical protein
MDSSKYGRIDNLYVLNTDEIVAGANKLVLDLYNATSSGFNMFIVSWSVMPKTDVAVTGVVSARFDLHRTSAIGTSGTTVPYMGTDPTKASVVSLDTNDSPLPTGITARTSLTGGATITSWLTSTFVHPEETNAASFVNQHLNVLQNITKINPVVCGPGQGILVKQGSVATLNNYVHQIVFGVKELE